MSVVTSQSFVILIRSLELKSISGNGSHNDNNNEEEEQTENDNNKEQ
ncbi:MAG TPA: hypothetical protein VGK47_00200 [Nitrososphaeraceae archaeon]